jgi:hypothetical protein
MVAAMMTVPEQTDFEDWPAEADPINMAMCPLIEVVMGMTAPGSPERTRAMNEVLAAGERVKRALVPMPRLQ